MCGLGPHGVVGFDGRGGAAVRRRAPAVVESDFFTLLKEKMTGMCGMVDTRSRGPVGQGGWTVAPLFRRWFSGDVTPVAFLLVVL